MSLFGARTGALDPRPARPALAASLRAADAAAEARRDEESSRLRRADDERLALAMAACARVDDMRGRRGPSLESAQTVRAIKALLDALFEDDAPTRFPEFEPDGLGRGSASDLAQLETVLRAGGSPPAGEAPAGEPEPEPGRTPPTGAAACAV